MTTETPPELLPCISPEGLAQAPAQLRLLLRKNMRSTSDTGRLIAEVGNIMRDRGQTLALHELERECLARPAAFKFSRVWDIDLISSGQLAICWRNGMRVGGAALMRQSLGRKDLAVGDLVALEWFPDGMPASVGDATGKIMRNTQWRVVELTGDRQSALLEHLRDPEVRFWMRLRVEVKSNHQQEAQRQVPHAPTPAQFNLTLRRGFYATWGGFVTAHKAQGDECDIVQISLDDMKAYAMSTHGRERCGFGFPAWVRWTYTAISRARQQVIFVSGMETTVPMLPDSSTRGRAWQSES